MLKNYMMYEFYKLNCFLDERADKWYGKNNDPVLIDKFENKERRILAEFSDYINCDWCGLSSYHDEGFLFCET